MLKPALFLTGSLLMALVVGCTGNQTPTPLNTEEVNKADRYVDPRRAIDSSTPDAYENNDYQYTAKVLTVGSSQQHNFYDDATDWVYFNVEKGNEYVVETRVLEKCDTQISLYEGSTLVGTSDDKSKEDYGSKIQFKATADAKLYLKVSSYGYRTGAGRPYALSLKKVGSEITPDDENNELPLAKKKWTFMVYLDGDNNLDSFGAKDIEEMASALKTEEDRKDLNVVVLWDTEGTKHGYYAIEDGKAVLKNDIGEPNMGEAQTAKDFIDWTTTNYPSDRHAFVFWNHGGAVDRGVCWDDSNGGDYLTEVEQLDIMDYGRTRIGKKFDLVGYDACLMACGELFYQLRNTADYMVASEQLEPGNGWDYTFLKTLISNPDSTGEALGRAILGSYASFYSTSRDVTFSLADLSMAGAFGTAVDAFCREAMRAKDGAVYGRLAKDLPLFGGNYTKDLVAYMNMVIKSTDPVVTSAVKARARDVVSAVNAMILREWHSSMWNNKAFGVAMTLKADTPVYSQHLICQATQWNEFCDFAEFPND